MLDGQVFAQDSAADRRAELASDTSSFVRRHAEDLVEWHVWGDEAFEKAKKLNRPLYVCVGYDSCHWCLRMQNESFNNPEIAELLNASFVNVIVDREHQPVLDSNFMMYMNANQGQSGWPLNVWITPDGVPFSVGSYFPSGEDVTSTALPEFTKVLRHIVAQWERFPDYINQQSKRDLEKLILKLADMDKLTDPGLIEKSKDLEAMHMAAYESISTRFDPSNGGFSNPFQFPQSGILRYLAALNTMEHSNFRGRQALKMIALTGEKMASGGLFDHLAGGFHRYALDPAWEVPRFEKLLITQAVMCDSYLSMYQVTKNPRFKDVARATLAFVENTLDAGDGLAFAGLQSDSPKPGSDVCVEGGYYTWTYDEFVSGAGDEAASLLVYMMDIQRGGNLSPGGNSADELRGMNVPRMKYTLADAAEKFGKSEAELATTANAGLRRLIEKRKTRTSPALDDNIEIGWNSLALSAFAKAGVLLEKPEFIQRAKTGVTTILTKHYDSDRGTLFHLVGKDGKRSGVYGFNYAAMIGALLDLYSATLDEAFLVRAVELQEHQIERFWDAKGGGFFEALPDELSDFLRLKSLSGDGAPSTNDISAFNLLQLGDLTKNSEYIERAKKIQEFSLPRQLSFPTSVPILLELDYHLRQPAQIALLSGPADSPLAKAMVKLFQEAKFFRTSLARLASDTALMKQHPDLAPFVEKSGAPAVIILRDGVPSAPLTDVSAIEAALSKR